MPKQVYVAAFEPIPPNCVGGFNWYWKEADARARWERLARERGGYTIYFFTFAVADGATQKDAHAITASIDEDLGALCAAAKESKNV